MSARTSAAWSYDAIAEIYATDMGRNMPFDDIGWYRALCQREAAGNARVLELGCGTGRILLDLMRAGVDAIGADRSLPMLARLRRDAAAHELRAEVVQMDIALPALRSVFDVILLPYSLVTYLRDPSVASNTIRHIVELLAPGGCLVLDAFVPQAVTSFTEFRHDYRRPHGSGWLERHKRITAHADGTNRIERIYRVLDAQGQRLEEFSTDETIRPYAPEELIRVGQSAGLVAELTAWDYGASTASPSAKFATVVLRKSSTASVRQAKTE